MYVIVTSQEGLKRWLANQGVIGVVVEQATERDVRDRDVVGVLPMHLAALARSVWVVDLPGLRPEQQGTDLSPAEMDLAGATLRRYVVIDTTDGTTCSDPACKASWPAA